jgi:hypothetical protein
MYSILTRGVSPIEVILLELVAIVIKLFAIPESTRRSHNLNSALPKALSLRLSYACRETPLSLRSCLNADNKATLSMRGFGGDLI